MAYGAFADIYDAFNEDANYDALAGYILRQLRAHGILFPGNAHSALRMMEKISSCFSSSSRSAPSFMNGTTVHP